MVSIFMARRELRTTLVLVTGGGRGIGRATAERLLARGARVALADVDLKTAEATAQALASLGDVRAYPLDVRIRSQFEVAVDRVEREMGPIDILLNNAGIMSLGAFLDQEESADVRQIEINLLGVIHGMRAVLPRMKARGRGHVVNVASMAGKIGIPYAATYAATKHAVVGLTESVRLELAGTGISMSYVMPIPVKTELLAGTAQMRWPPLVTPEAVAKAIVDALETGRVAVFVPGFQRWVPMAAALLPHAVLDRIARLTGMDRLFKDVDWKARADYVARTTEPAEPALRVVGSSDDRG